MLDDGSLFRLYSKQRLWLCGDKCQLLDAYCYPQTNEFIKQEINCPDYEPVIQQLYELDVRF